MFNPNAPGLVGESGLEGLGSGVWDGEYGLGSLGWGVWVEESELGSLGWRVSVNKNSSDPVNCRCAPSCATWRSYLPV